MDDVSYTLVRPNTPLVPEIIKLSPIDQFSNRVYSPLLLFFKFDAEVLRKAICRDLQGGLANLIKEVPFIAGSVFLEDEETGSLQIEIPEDAGVMFKIREMLDSRKGPVLEFQSLEKAGFSSSLLDPSELGPIHFLPESVAPVLAIQANIIRGGMILACYIHHSTTDGLGLMALCQRWSRHVSAEVASCTIPTSESLPEEILDRSVLFPDTSTWRSLRDFPGIAKVCKSAPVQDQQPEIRDNHVVRQPPELTIAYWYISPRNLRALEQAAKPSDNGGFSFTTSCVLCAFLWQCCMRAKRLEQHNVKTVSIFMRCSIRRRIDPPLHPQFLGNAVVHCRAEISLAELVASKPGTLYWIASLVNDCIEWYSSDKIWELLAAMSATPRFGDIEPIMDDVSETIFKITDMSMVPLHSSHWGARMGNVCAMRIPGIFVLDGEAIILPRLPDGGIEFSTHLPVEALNALKADTEFTRYMQFRCS